MMRKNYEYIANNNHYFTDGLGRVDFFYGHPVNEAAERDCYAQRHLDGKQPGENAGHIFAARHGGYGGTVNLTRQDAMINQRDIAAFERETDEILKSGHNVRIHGEITYIGDSNLPDAYLQTRETLDENNHVIDCEHRCDENFDRMIHFQKAEDNAWVDLAQEYDNPGAIIVDDHNQIQQNSALESVDSLNEQIEDISDGNTEEECVYYV